MKATPYVPARNANPGVRVVQLEDEAPIPSGFWNMAFVFWMATIFILFSRLFDVFLAGFYVPKAVLSLMVLFFLISGRPLFFLKTTGGKIALCFMVWAAFTVIFSVWKSASIQNYTDLLQSMFFFAVAAGLPMTVLDVRKTVSAFAFSGLCAALLSFHFGVDREGRMALAGGSYFDPNYFGMALAAAVPLLWQSAATAQSKVTRIFAWLGMPIIFLVLAKTGSRGAMLAFALMLLLLFLISSVKIKILLLFATAIGLVVLLATLPGYVRERYLTLFSSDSVAAESPADNNSSQDRDRLGGDIGSTEQRKRLLKESITLTLEHPIVGVGPGNFQTAVFNEATAAGMKHNEWMATHNSYTQISSETGFPGLILVLCLIASSFRNVGVVLKGSSPNGEKPDPVAYATAMSLLLSLTVIVVCVFFLAVAYDFPIYVWAGLTIGLRRVYDQKKIAQDSSAEEPEPLVAARTAFVPAYAKIQDREPQPQTRLVSGRPVRFNRFR